MRFDPQLLIVPGTTMASISLYPNSSGEVVLLNSLRREGAVQVYFEKTAWRSDFIKAIMAQLAPKLSEEEKRLLTITTLKTYGEGETGFHLNFRYQSPEGFRIVAKDVWARRVRTQKEVRGVTNQLRKTGLVLVQLDLGVDKPVDLFSEWIHSQEPASHHSLLQIEALPHSTENYWLQVLEEQELFPDTKTGIEWAFVWYAERV